MDAMIEMKRTRRSVDTRAIRATSSGSSSSGQAGKALSRKVEEGKQAPKPKTILIIDDHALVYEGMKLLLEETDLSGDVLYASSGIDALEVLEKRQVDLVLLDIFLVKESGLDLIAKIKELNADLPVIIISVSEDSCNIRQAISAGADGYIVKSASREVLIQSLHLALTGQKVALLPLNSITESHPDNDDGLVQMNGAAEVGDRHSRLTRREAKVLELIKEGMSNKEIARALDILEGTVKVHVKSIFRKLGAKNRTVAALMAASIAENGGGESIDK